jgi:hypothetical protein
MDTHIQISEFLNSLSETKKKDIEFIHQRILDLYPKEKLWYVDGKNETGKVVANPQIGYGHYTIQYTDGKTKEFYRVGISANTLGISVYIMGIDDKNYLVETYKDKLGKAQVTGYCIKFKNLKDIDIKILEDAIKDRMERKS